MITYSDYRLEHWSPILKQQACILAILIFFLIFYDIIHYILSTFTVVWLQIPVTDLCYWVVPVTFISGELFWNDVWNIHNPIVCEYVHVTHLFIRCVYKFYYFLILCSLGWSNSYGHLEVHFITSAMLQTVSTLLDSFGRAKLATLLVLVS